VPLATRGADEGYFRFEQAIAFGVQAMPDVEHCGLPAASRLQTWQEFVHSAQDTFLSPHDSMEAAGAGFSNRGFGMRGTPGASASAPPANAVNRKKVRAARIMTAS